PETCLELPAGDATDETVAAAPALNRQLLLAPRVQTKVWAETMGAAHATAGRGFVRNFARISLGAVLFTSTLAFGSTVLKFENDELTRRAEVIVHGKCTK